jgi:hypothetical protein
VFFHDGEKPRDIWILARSGAGGPARTAGRDGKEFAACEIAHSGGFEEAGVEEVGSGSSGVESQGADGRDEGEEDVRRFYKDRRTPVLAVAPAPKNHPVLSAKIVGSFLIA